jgi:hypothetical protein
VNLEAQLEQSMEIINLGGAVSKLPKLMQWNSYTPKNGLNFAQRKTVGFQAEQSRMLAPEKGPKASGKHLSCIFG